LITSRSLLLFESADIFVGIPNPNLGNLITVCCGFPGTGLLAEGEGLGDPDGVGLGTSPGNAPGV
jgi:hypothetical protein